MVRGNMALNGIFSIFPLAGPIKRMAYLKKCHRILKQVFIGQALELLWSYVCVKANEVTPLF